MLIESVPQLLAFGYSVYFRCEPVHLKTNWL